jgi:hypothetical protein
VQRYDLDPIWILTDVELRQLAQLAGRLGNRVSAGAILTVAAADGQVGPNRLIDAVIGAGVALVCTQLLCGGSRAAARLSSWLGRPAG